MEVQAKEYKRRQKVLRNVQASGHMAGAASEIKDVAKEVDSTAWWKMWKAAPACHHACVLLYIFLV